MKIAIVGTSSMMTDNEERDVRQLVSSVLKHYNPDNDIVISGGAVGVDKIAIEVAKGLGFKTDHETYKPKSKAWKDYKARNLMIAKDCNELYCVTIPVHNKKCYHHKTLENHEKTAGCWTMKEAKELNKPCRLLVTVER